MLNGGHTSAQHPDITSVVSCLPVGYGRMMQTSKNADNNETPCFISFSMFRMKISIPIIEPAVT